MIKLYKNVESQSIGTQPLLIEALLTLYNVTLFLQGLHFHVTPSILPAPNAMREIIECAGGKVHYFQKKYSNTDAAFG